MNVVTELYTVFHGNLQEFCGYDLFLCMHVHVLLLFSMVPFQRRSKSSFDKWGFQEYGL